MCGIAGQVRADGAPVDARLVAAMGRSLRHRGPDDAGTYVHGGVGLAHQRLSVIDLSPAGHQPMSNKEGTVWIVFNGEVYNFQELRSQLAPRHDFRSRTDTEVILHLYEEYGLQCFSRLRGMFAIAIWDKSRQRLVLARDRIGKKPLFYRTDPRGLSFASELKALLVEGTVPPVDNVALHHYLTFQYVPAPRTIFQGIRKLRPGHLLVYERGQADERAYWSLDYDRKLTGRSEREHREEFFRLLEESVRLRLISDVPLGAFLSGGVDSSSVVALMSRLTDQPVKTFSIGFKEESFNELPYARQVAQRFKTEHHEFLVEPSALELLPTLVRVYDEPFADPSAIPTYYVSQLSRQFVTVVLNGDGGDELLGGYPRYGFRPRDRVKARLLPQTLGDGCADLLDRLPALPGVSRLRGLAERVAVPFSRAYLPRLCCFLPAEKRSLYTPEFLQAVREDDSYALLSRWFRDARASDLLDQLLDVDTHSYLPDDVLVKVDRASMAHGLEARSPFLDHQLVEFAASLPVDYKVRNGQSKYMLKAAMRGLLPDAVLDRDKMGFGVPVDRWFRHELSGFVREVLLSPVSLQRGYFRPEFIRAMIDNQQAGACAYGSRVYALVMLELWHREYVDQRPSCAAEMAGVR